MSWNSENFCKQMFDEFLRRKFRCFTVGWEDVPKGSDPPDFWLTLDDITFAVEVTDTKINRVVIIGDGQIEEFTYLHSGTQLTDEIRKAAIKQGVLHGGYVISFAEPISCKSYYQKVQKKIINDSLRFIRETKNENSTPHYPIKFDRQTVCRVRKFQNVPDGVYETFCDSVWNNSPEFKETVRQILQEAISTKKQKFIGKLERSHDIRLPSAPRILLVNNTYSFATNQNYSNAIKEIDNKDFFHSVFLVNVYADNDKVTILSSVNKSWTLGNDK